MKNVNGTVLHIQNKKTKDGKDYKIFHVLVVIEGNEFIRKFYVFS